MKTPKGIRGKVFALRAKYVSNRNYVILLSMLTGLVAGLAGVILKSLIGFIEHSIVGKAPGVFYMALPLAGLFISLLLSRHIFRQETGFGVADILYSVTRKNGIIPRVQTYSRMITAAFTVAFGGSVGLEAPIVVTGSAIGSNLSRFFHLDSRKRMLFIGCGAAAGMAAIFNSPVAGVIFAMEVILIEYSISSFIPLLLSAAMGSLTSIVLLSEHAIFSFPGVETFHYLDIPFYILLGIFCGLVSAWFTFAYFRTSRVMGRIKSPYFRTFTGGILLGGIIFVFPVMFGEGYLGIKYLLEGRTEMLTGGTVFHALEKYQWGIYLFLILTLFIKVIATAVTISAGGAGGTFAPSMFTGGFSGFLFASLLNDTGLFRKLSEFNFTLVGMCGVLSAVMHAPLSAIFLIAEITESYQLMIPLMIVSAIAFFTKTFIQRHSIITQKLAEKGELIRENKDKQILVMLNTKKLIEKDIKTVSLDASLGDLVKVVEESRRNLFPVIDKNGKFKGIILLDDIRKIMFNQEEYDTVFVKSLMHEPPELVKLDDDMEMVMRKFDKTAAWNLPVVDDEGGYIGIVSKSTIFSSYRNWLKRQEKGILE